MKCGMGGWIQSKLTPIPIQLLQSGKSLYFLQLSLLSISAHFWSQLCNATHLRSPFSLLLGKCVVIQQFWTPTVENSWCWSDFSIIFGATFISFGKDIFSLNLQILSLNRWNLLVLEVIDVSGIMEKFNIYITLAIIPRMKDINKAFWLVHMFIKTLSFSLLGKYFHSYTMFTRKIWLFYNITFIPETSNHASFVVALLNLLFLQIFPFVGPTI